MDAQNESMDAKTARRRCKNCGEKLSKTGKFCPHCSQRDFDGRIRMRELLGKFFTNLTHLDNKFVKMAWHLLVPARVSLAYFEGKIRRYPHPVQFFFIVMFFFLYMFSRTFDNAGFSMLNGNLSIGGQESYALKKGGRMLSEEGMFEALQHCVAAREHRAAFDSLPEAWRTPIVRSALDSTVNVVEGPWEIATTYILHQADTTQKRADISLDTLPITFVTTTVRIATVDLVSLNPDSIIQKYGFTNWMQKVTVRQGIKSLKEPRNLIHRYVGSLGWAVLVLIGLMAGVLKLLYWRRGSYYVEHFIFLMHQQSGMFLLLTFLLVISQFLFSLAWFWLVVFAWLAVSLLLSLKWFYRESWGWTALKWMVFTLFYFFGLTILFIATLLVVFVVF